MNIPVNLQASLAAQTNWLAGNGDARGAGLAATAGGLTGASMVESRSGEISLETMEGDRVTLSFSSRMEATYQVYNARGSLEGGAQASLETFTLKSGSEMTIAIEGELSDAEKADIEMVMSVVEEMAEEFFEGDVDSALAELLKMGGAKTLAGLQVSLESSRGFTINGGQAAALTGQDSVPVNGTVDGAGTGAAPDAQATASGQPAAGTQPSIAPPPVVPDAQATAPPAPPVAPADQSGRITVDTTNGLVGSMTSVVEGSGVSPSIAQKHILKLLDRLFDKIADEFGFNEDKHKVAELVKSEFAAGLNEIAGGEPHETDGHDNGFAHKSDKPGHRHGREHEHRHEHKHRH